MKKIAVFIAVAVSLVPRIRAGMAARTFVSYAGLDTDNTTNGTFAGSFTAQ